MYTPSITTLSQVFDNPAEAKRVLTMTHAELAAHPVGAARIVECYHHPAWSDVRLTVLNSLDSGLCGIETLETTKGEYADYLNTGDSYTPTVIYWRGRYRVSSVGDFIEAREKNSIHFI